MKLSDIHSVYFVGIGGIGMSALARWFKANGCFVSGYDSTETSLTNVLQKEGIDIHFEDSVELIPQQVREDKSSLVVYTPAIPDDHKEFNFFLNSGYTIQKRSEVLGVLTHSIFTIAVAGTHGKTTTSSMIAHLLKSANINCTAFVGGIMTNYESNLIIGDKGQKAIMVVEADEFDRSFLTLHPDIAVITAVDADHLDIYGTAEELKESFKLFIQNIKKNGQLFIEESAAGKIDDLDDQEIRITTYGLSKGQIYSDNLKAIDGKFKFNYSGDGITLDGLELSLPGYHNVANATAAISVANSVELSAGAIESGISSYQGVKRRFEYIIHTDSLVFIDDYAHHPVEIEALLTSVRTLFPERMITAVFQPHLYSRTKDFSAGFAASLNAADEVILLDIYPARELPIPGITSDIILDEIDLENKHLTSKDGLLNELKQKNLDVLLTIGAGDIDKLVQPIKEILLNKK